MTQELFYTTSQAAAHWGCSQQRVVDLCRSGLIECETTQGGHYRISERVMEHYKARGLPSLPRPLPDDGPAFGRSSNRHHGNADQDDDPSRAAARSPEVVRAYTAVHQKKAERLALEEDRQLQRLRKEIQQEAWNEAQEQSRQAAQRRREKRQKEEEAFLLEVLLRQLQFLGRDEPSETGYVEEEPDEHLPPADPAWWASVSKSKTS